MMRAFILLALLMVFFSTWMPAQIGVALQVDSAVINLTCGDLIGNPEPMWGVNVNSEGYQYYPQDGPCFEALPNQQFLATGSCPTDLPTEIEVCFYGFENDPTFPPPVSCAINPDCEATICQNFSIPAIGQIQPLSLDLPVGGDVTGTLYFTLAAESLTPVVTNDLICDAIDFGVINFNSSLGSLTGPVYSNYCATNVQEPNPADDLAPGTFGNDQGVWFTFQTGDAPSGILLLDVKSDPLQTGDEFDAQVAVYEFSGGVCTGTPSLVQSRSDNSSFDISMQLRCITPNTTYYILVDGGNFGNESIEGPFSIRITDPGVIEGGDLRCDFEDLGVVEENGYVETDGFRSNFCSTDIGDPFVGAFVSQHSVWFSFIAPPSGHVYIDALSDQLVQPIDAQLAIYSPFTGTCSGGLRHLQSQYTAGDFDESLEVSCLFGGQRYFVLVDGSDIQTRGIFKLSISDAGDITPLTVVDTLLCAGESITIGTNTYTTTGNYIDTLNIRQGCDSIVHTNLTVGEPLVVSFQQTKFAFGEGGTDAEARLTVTGGYGIHEITWCDGQTGELATGLTGGTVCCVTVVDDAGCSYQECYEIGYLTGVIPLYQDTSVACKGDENGVITLSGYGGLPPYLYTWESADGQFSGNGAIDVDFEEIFITDLPAGLYTFNIKDSFRDSTFTVQVREPARLVGQFTGQREITCHGACNGGLVTEITGGTAPYDLQWEDGVTGLLNRDDLCPGIYTLQVTDANGCRTTLVAELEDPSPFTAQAELVKDVSCYQGADGRIGVSTQNGTPATYHWSNGAGTPSQSGLSAGFYQVTVTSDLFCQSVSDVEVTQPAKPLSLEIEMAKPISCGGEEDGVLSASVDGPYQNLTYLWSNGSAAAVTQNLPAGAYSLQIRNERGCTAEDSIVLEEPPQIAATYSTRDITCLDPPESGIVFVDAVSGGLGGYRYSIDGDQFTSAPVIRNLSGGEYVLIVQDQGGCERQFPFRIGTPPELSVTLGEETVVLNLGDSIQISASSNSSSVRYQWDHDPSVIGPSTVIAPQISTRYRVKAEDTQTFCRAEATVFVQVDKRRRVFIPNAFSPNMDGNNDYFFINGDNDIVSIDLFRIFNREGQLVFEKGDFTPNDASSGWDGTFNGSLLNSGVFVYFAKITFVDGLTETFSGDVVLVR